MHDFTLVIAGNLSELSATCQRLARSGHRRAIAQGRCGISYYVVVADPLHCPDLSGHAENDQIRLSIGYGISRDPPQDQVEGLAIQLAIDSRAGEISVNVPLTCPHQLFYTRQERSLLISTQIRALSGGSAEIEPRAAYSLLQFGAVFPPWSIFRGIHRFTPGKITTIRCVDMTMSEAAAHGDRQQAGPTDGGDLDAQVLALLDAEMQRLCPDGSAAIMFSGGLDSGLLAARAAALGWRDAILVHLSFDRDDYDTAVASRMAAELALPIEIVPYDPEQVGPILETAGTTYPQPFSDPAVATAAQLIKHLLTRFPDHRTIFSGDGSASVFGMAPKINMWRRLYRLPLVARRLGGLGYRSGEMAANTGRFAWAFSVLRRSALFRSPLAAVLAVNPLLRIAYHFEPDVVQDVLNAIDRWVDETVPVHAPSAYGWLRQLHHNAGIVVQTYSPFVGGTGRTVAYPFMEPSFLHFGIGPAARRINSEPPRAVLKRLLSRQVSRDLVYRPKSGFGPRRDTILPLSAVAQILRDPALCESGSLAPYLSRHVVSKLAELGAAGHRLPIQTSHFLWTLVFATKWLDQACPADHSAGSGRVG